MLLFTKGIDMHLETYLKETGQSQAAFGAKLNPPASQGLVSQWIRGVTRITLHYSIEIVRESEGVVSPQDCADMYSESKQRGN